MGNYLPSEAHTFVDDPEGLSGEFWKGAREGKICIQRCKECHRFQWGPEWICHYCHSASLGYEEVGQTGTIYSWERVWHASQPWLRSACPYVVVIVELDDPRGIRLAGNLLGDPLDDVVIGSTVTAEFEHNAELSLIQWRRR
jgi:uncharacterized protein